MNSKDTFLIGIDVGYSDTRKTCGIAVNTKYLTDQCFIEIEAEESEKPIYRRNFTLRDACEWLDSISEIVRRQATFIVIDGPIRPAPSDKQREVDLNCQKGKFQDRAVPVSAGNSYRKLEQATDRLLKAVGGNQWRDHCQFSHQQPSDSFPLIWETNPTIGMAVVLPVVNNTSCLPSRNRHVNIPNNTKTIRSKSDYYWEIGANNRIAESIGNQNCASVINHESRAALYCLAVAFQISGCAAKDAAASVCVGDSSTGTYLLLGPPDSTWQEELNRIGIV